MAYSFIVFAFQSALAGPVAGMEWVPLGRGDAAWIESEQLTGTLVAEGDGWLDPPLNAWGGYRWDRWMLLGSLGMAAHNTITLQANAEEGVDRTRMMVMAIRPGLDVRRALGEGEMIRSWAGGGLYGVLPIVRYSSDLFSDEEQASYDQLAVDDRARIIGVGGRAVMGTEVVLGEDSDSDSQWALGVQAGWGLHRAQVVEDTVIRVSWRSQIETAIILSFYR